MATINVKDAAGATVAIEKPIAPGRLDAAASKPIVLSNEDLAAIDAITAKLSDDPATQTTLAALLTSSAAILAKIIAAPATSAKQDTLIAKDFATQTTLAAILAKIIAAPATETTAAAILAKIIAAPATSAKQDTLIAKDFATSTKQDTLIAKDFATQTTLAAILAKVITSPATETTSAAILAKLIAGPATETTSAAILAKIIASPATEATLASLLTDIALAASSEIIGKVKIVDVNGVDLDWLGAATATLSTVASSASSQMVLDTNTSRKGLMCVNTDPNVCRIKYGTTASATSFTDLVAGSGSPWYMPYPVYTGRIDAIWDVDGAGSLFVTEF